MAAADGTTRRRGIRRILFPAAAVALGLTPLLASELLLACLGVGDPDYQSDPFVGFTSIRPLFVLDRRAGMYKVSPARYAFFCPDSFAAVKAPDEFRIFCLGGSTVQGRPYAVETSFTTWLELALRAADPAVHWQVVNCGGVSYASYRLVPILQEVLGYQPDLIILYTGQNEFLEQRSYGQVKRVAGWLSPAAGPLLRLRTFAVVCGLVRQVGWGQSNEAAAAGHRRRAMLGPEADALLDYRGGLDLYHRDPALRRAVIAHFDYNLRRMVALCRRASVPILIINPTFNLRDCPPFKCQHRDGLTADQLQRWQALWNQARTWYRRDLRQAVRLLEQARAIDDQHAGLHYELAKCYEAIGALDQARREYLLAKETDICPLRILEPMSQAIVRVCRQTATPMVDVRALFERLSPVRIPGGDLLVDHVHPSIRGHQIIANVLADELIRLGLVRPQRDWRQHRDRSYRRHLASLDDLYFAKGKQRLEAVMAWAHGRVTATRPGAKAPAQTEPAVANK